ncbi:hypothetical protein EVAR_96130_1 [Eumeta japonica]|uniref:Uncharacterized protein n=1 Tax=Eumeta variegata TaxID=151549 RepID=A0A4C2A5L0_EUMVA|nr:hypothetical protein EVAR_96130_1 [Eumeta japonica]
MCVSAPTHDWSLSLRCRTFVLRRDEARFACELVTHSTAEVRHENSGTVNLESVIITVYFAFDKSTATSLSKTNKHSSKRTRSDYICLAGALDEQRNNNLWIGRTAMRKGQRQEGTGERYDVKYSKYLKRTIGFSHYFCQLCIRKGQELLLTLLTHIAGLTPLGDKQLTGPLGGLFPRSLIVKPLAAARLLRTLDDINSGALADVTA